MVDVLFLLLIFFMSTYSMREQELQLKIGLPAAQSAEPGSNQAQRVIVSFDKDGQIMLGERVVQVENLVAEMSRLAEISPGQPVIVRGDFAGDYGLFVRIVDAAQTAGLGEVSIATSEAEGP